MKNFLATLTILVFTFFLQGCNDDLQIQGSKHIYINEAQPYKLIPLSEDTQTADSYKWKVKSKNKDYTLTYDETSAVTFNAQSVGTYTLEVKVKKDHKTFKTELEIEVTEPEVINGYTLPSEPDKTLNDSTLLGIDVNDNGVRDDIERKIIITYKEPIKIEPLMAAAKIGQEILANPVSLAKEHSDKMDRVDNCSAYIRETAPDLIDELVNIKFYENNMYNTKERLKAYLEYNQALSGGVYGSGPADWTADKCDFDVEQMLKDSK
ncbi:MAG: hypothetical protein IE887_05710 [Campylobacterales bacterium]|nr:hypothetical protein [Campylobacterales bacterium]